MSKGGGNAPSPDPNIGVAATKQAQTGEGWLNYAKDQAAIANKRQGPIDALARDVQTTQLGVMKDQQRLGLEDRARYEKTFRPMEDRLVNEAQQAGTPAMQDAEAARAASDIQSAAAGARGSAAREAAAVGIAPGSGQYAGIQRAGEAATALSTAGAKNNARAAERGRGLALTADVANMGRGLPAQAAAGAASAVGAGNAAYGIAGANQQLSMAPTAIMGQGFQGAMGGYQGQANTLSNLYGMQLQKYQIDQEAKSTGISGIANAVGSLAGLAIASSPKFKKNVKSTKAGSGLKAIKKMPVKKFDYKPGHGDGGKGHIGTMSTSFAKATGGKDQGVIMAQDAIGITMKAVQDLDKKVDSMGKRLGIKAPQPRRSTQSPAKARKAEPGRANVARGKKGLRGPDVKPMRAKGVGVA